MVLSPTPSFMCAARALSGLALSVETPGIPLRGAERRQTPPLGLCSPPTQAAFPGSGALGGLANSGGSVGSDGEFASQLVSPASAFVPEAAADLGS